MDLTAWRPWLVRTRPRRRPRPRTRRLEVETLEARVTPTVVYQPQLGAETVSSGSGYKLSSVPIYGIFWGSQWNSASAATIANEVSAICSGPYLSGLTQYGSDGRASYAGTVFNSSNPNPNGFSLSDINGVVANAIAHQGLPAPNGSAGPLYLVVTSGASFGPDAGLGGLNAHDPNDNATFAWVDTTSPSVFSHEIAEAMSDPVDPTGITVSGGETSAPSEQQIGDGEAGSYLRTVNGVQVQSYWSQRDGGFIVPDGNRQNLYLNGGTLTINGDQLGANFNDTIIVGGSLAGGIRVTLNGEVTTFDPYAISTIHVNTGGGQDTVLVRAGGALGGGTVSSSGARPLKLVETDGSVLYTSDPMFLSGDVVGNHSTDVIIPMYDPDKGLIVRTLLAQGDGTFREVDTPLGDGPAALTHPLVADVNGDGRADLIFPWADPQRGLVIYTHLSNGDGTFSPDHDSFLGDGPAVFTDPFVGDVNGDGKADLIMPWKDSGRNGALTIYTHLSNGDGTFSPDHDTFLGDGPAVFTDPFVGDVNGDGKADLIMPWADSSRGGALTIYTHLANGDGTFSPDHDTFLGDGPAVFTDPLAGDVNNDGNVDLVMPWKDSSRNGALTVYTHLSNGNGTFSADHDSNFGDGPAVFTDPLLGDVNGDGSADLIMPWADSSRGGALAIYTHLANGDGTFSPDHDSLLGDGPAVLTHPLVGDVNGDGRADVIMPWTDASRDGSLTIYTHLSNGNGLFSADHDTIINDGPNPNQAMIGGLVMDGGVNLAGWTVQVLNPSTGFVLASATTDSGGSYNVSDLPAGTYRVRVVPPAGWGPVGPNPSDVSLTAGQSATGIDFSVQQFFTLSGTALTIRGTPGGGNWFAFSQRTTADAAGAHTTYTFTIDGLTQSYADTALTSVSVTAAGAGNGAVLTTSDTYTGTDGRTHETAEQVLLGNGGGTLEKVNAQGTAVPFVALSGFQDLFAIAGQADQGAIIGTAGVFNYFAGYGSYAFLSTGPAFYYVSGASSVVGYSEDYYDWGINYDGSGPSYYTAAGTLLSEMSGTDNGKTFLNEAYGFHFNEGIATHSGDVAYLSDSPGNDVLLGYGQYASLTCAADGEQDYLTTYNGNFFAQVYAYAFNGGYDTASIDPSAAAVYSVYSFDGHYGYHRAG